MSLSTLLLAAVLAGGSALAAPADLQPIDAEWVRAHPDALPLLQEQDRLRAAAYQAFVQAPELAARIADARPMPSRSRSVRLPPGITAPQAAAVHLDHALHGEPQLRPAHARLGAALIDDPELLAGVLAGPDASVRAAALAGLRGRAEAPWTRLIVDSVSDPDASVREAAVSLLGRRPEASENLDVLSRASTDPSSAVRALAVRALGIFGDQSQVGVVTARLTDAEAPVRLAAVHALERLAPDRVRDLAAGLVDDPDPGVRRALQQLGSGGSPAR